jgi:CRP/FNR family cyclic AMP-dependent transcriptional regulator
LRSDLGPTRASWRFAVTDVSDVQEAVSRPLANHVLQRILRPPRGADMARKLDPRVATLSTIEVLAGLSGRQLDQICGRMTEVVLREGSVLCRQGEYAREVFLVVDGHVAVSLCDRPISVVGRGAIVGEMALLEGLVRSATATALDDVTVLVMSAGEFHGLLGDLPVVAANILALAASRRDEIALLVAA